MLEWTFELNNKPMSAFKHEALSFPAFSGYGKNVNQRIAMCQPNQGPIPVGTYYIMDRQTGGFLGPLRDLLNDHREWFALYAIDEKIDDETFCENVKRGNFRLHPRGSIVGISRGCITIEKLSDFHRIRAMLKGVKKAPIPNTQLFAYGKVTVK